MFDLVIELHRGRESSLVMKMVNARNRVTSDGAETTGLARLIGRISSVLAARPASPEHLAQRYLRLIEPIGVRPIEAEPRLTTDRESDIRTEKWLEKGGIRSGDLLVGVHPGAGPRINRWPLDRFTSVGRRLIHNFGARLIVIGGPSERGIARQLSKEMPARQSLVLQSPQIPELVSLLARLSVLITNHSGPAHVAAALKTPVVVASSMNVPAEVNLLSKTHIPIRGISAEMILEEDVYEAACRLIKASRSDSLWTR
jgi:ADP-heptose:LPS heptosyltransferase